MNTRRSFYRVALGGLFLAASIVGGGLFSRGEARPRRSRQDIDRLIKRLEGKNIGARDAAAQRLYHLQDPRGNAAVIDLTTARDARRRAIGVWALAIVRPPGASALLRKRISDVVPSVRRAALLAMARLRVVGAVKEMRRALKDRDASVRRTATRGLSLLGKKGLVVLAHLMKHASLELRLIAVRALGRLRVKEAHKLLRRIARPARDLVSLLAAEELLRKGDLLAANVLVSLALRAPQKGLRLQAIAALGRDTSARGERALRRLLKERDLQLRAAAQRSLSQREKRRTPSSCHPILRHPVSVP